MSSLLRFPDPVNEVSARLVAAGVVLMCGLVLTGRTWVLAVLAYGFVARVATGPTLSPLGQVVTRLITPRLPLAERLVPGGPKRFAQGIGAALSVGAAVLHFCFAATTPALVLVGAITVAATLEAALGFCLGCWLFARLIALGVVPEQACAACDDLRLRHPSSAWTH
jgi:hypothetical protein